ncbi:MAG: hypothetical protein ACE5K3_10780 [bacterium]
MNEKLKKVLNGVKGKVTRGHKTAKEKVPEKVLEDFDEAANFIIERHKDTIKELEKY